MARVRRRSRLASWYVTIPLSIAVVVSCGVMWFELDEDRKEHLLQWRFFSAEEDEEENGVEFDTLDHDGEDASPDLAVSKLQEKYAAIPEFFDLTTLESGPKANHASFTPNQFIHLHHMKTGGTSMDALLRCAMDRLKKDGEYDVPYFNIHECSEVHYQGCVDGSDQRCQDQAQKASIMSYCAPLRDLPIFGWNNTPAVGSITVLRHPVDRVWSMYRFQTKSCYGCRPLLDIYADIDAGNFGAFKSFNCVHQLINHEMANLLSSKESESNSDDEKVAEAISNLNYFTLVGLTESLPETVEMAGELFPWMAEDVDFSSKKCVLEHKNASPENNHCGLSSTHMPLPYHPDEATRKAIEEHNQLDMQLYEAAVRHFEFQKQAMGRD